MDPIILYPDPVELALPYLRDLLGSDAAVHGRIPNPRPAYLVHIRRAGGVPTARNVADRPRVDAQVWAPTDPECVELAGRVLAYLLAAPGRVDGVSFARAFLGLTPIPDPDTGSPRILLTVEWQIRGSEAEVS
jgi:hypothetical protein